uniref:hypothetical protein n=1 Tax=Cryptomonas gyropyrenoidosa TaxID=233257 RepID=UPI00279A1040|nr:hypothetical protein QLP26_pgp016 [Cryptomonas gyropyrenoidosa]WFQ82926.1 hypothetical protein [Cryptomonas gyropyrenoidosa]
MPGESGFRVSKRLTGKIGSTTTKEVIRMNDKPLDRLEHLRKKNVKNSMWINKNLYRFFFLEEIYSVVYKRIKSKGNFVNKKFEEKLLTSKIQYVIDLMRHNKFNYITQEFFDTLALDKKDLHKEFSFYLELIKEIVQMLLILVYQPFFLKNKQELFLRSSFFSHKKKVNCQFKMTSWVIQSNYRSTFNEINLGCIINLLRERIKDERFLSLILNILKFESFQKSNKKSQLDEILHPDGEILSSLLKSLYFRELDRFVQKKFLMRDQVKILIEKQRLEACRFVVINNYKKQDLKNNVSFIVKENHILDSCTLKTQELPDSVSINPTLLVKNIYIRYIDQWILGIDNGYSVVFNLKHEILQFLQSKLKFKITEDKLQITSLCNQQVTFLNYQIGTTLTNKSNCVVNDVVVLKIPVRKVVAMLSERGFCNRSGKPKSKKSWITHEDNKIIKNYNVLLKKIIMYYIKTNNFNKLIHIQRILKISCLHTLAQRHKSSLRKIFEKYAFKLKM